MITSIISLIATTREGTLPLTLNDGRPESSWDCDRDVLQKGRRHHLTVIVDGGPNIISFVVDGTLCDGGESRQFGWGRFDPKVGDVNGSDKLRLSPSFTGDILGLRIHNRTLRTFEAVANHQAGATR